MKIKPLNDNLLVKLTEKKEITDLEVLLPDTFDKEQESQIGEVIEVPKGIKEPKKGDRIIFDKFAPLSVKIEEEKICFVKCEEVLGILYDQRPRVQSIRKKVSEPSEQEKDFVADTAADVPKGIAPAVPEGFPGHLHETVEIERTAGRADKE